MKTRYQIMAALLCMLLAATAFATDEKPAQPQEFKHRVTGLFQPDRVEDLGRLVAQLPEVKLVSVDFKSAEAVFSYDAAKLGGGKPEKALEHLDNLVRNASRSTFGIKPLSATPRERSAAAAFSPYPSERTPLTAIARTFFSAPATSTPIGSSLT